MDLTQGSAKKQAGQLRVMFYSRSLPGLSCFIYKSPWTLYIKHKK